MLAEPILVFSKMIEPPVKPVVADELSRDAAKILKGGSHILFFGHAKFRNLPAVNTAATSA